MREMGMVACNVARMRLLTVGKRCLLRNTWERLLGCEPVTH